MGSVPGLPSNPSALVCDTSSLVQVFAADMAKLLHLLKVRYRVQPVIVEAVEGELPGVLSRRHPDKVASFEKSLRKGTIRILDEALLRELHGGPEHGGGGGFCRWLDRSRGNRGGLGDGGGTIGVLIHIRV